MPAGTEKKYLLPIKGLDSGIVPEVSLVGMNLFETQLYVQENGLRMLSSQEINKVARAVKEEKPTEEFLKYALEHSNYDERFVTELYKRLHEQLWDPQKGYWIRANELLLWSELAEPNIIQHPRIKLNGRQTPSKRPHASKGLQAYLITDYKVIDKGDGDYQIETDTGSTVPIDWPKEDGAISPELSSKFSATRDTHVRTNPDMSFEEGLRTLYWVFRGRDAPHLYSAFRLSGGVSYMGSLLGRKS